MKGSLHTGRLPICRLLHIHFTAYLTGVSMILAVFILFLSSPVVAQDSFADKSYYLIDSLDLNSLTQSDRDILDSALTMYHKAPHDTGRLNSLNIICEQMMDDSWHKYQFLQYSMIQDIIATGEPLAQEKGFLIIQAMALNNIGYIYMNKSEFSLAMDFYEQSLNIQQGINDETGEATSLNNIGLIYEHQGDIENALKFYHRSLEIKEKLGHKRGISYSLNNLGVIYSKQGDTEKALIFYNKSLKIRKEIGFKSGIAESLRNMAVSYERMGDSDKALELLKRSLVIDRETGEKRAVVNSLSNIGVIYENRGYIDSAAQYFHEGLTLSEEIGNKRLIARSLTHIAELLVEHPGVGDFEAPRYYATRGLAIAQEIGSPHSIQYCARGLSKIARQEGNYKEALEMYELHIKMQDSTNNENTQKATIRQQTKYEFEKAQLVKEQEEQEKSRKEKVKRQRRDNLQYSVILIALLVIGGLLSVIGRFSIPIRVVEGLIFFSFLILFEFILVLADPYVDVWTGGAPGWKLLINAAIAALIFPLHSLFERKLKGRLNYQEI